MDFALRPGLVVAGALLDEVRVRRDPCRLGGHFAFDERIGLPEDREAALEGIAIFSDRCHGVVVVRLEFGVLRNRFDRPESVVQCRELRCCLLRLYLGMRTAQFFSVQPRVHQGFHPGQPEQPRAAVAGATGGRRKISEIGVRFGSGWFIDLPVR